MCRQQDIHGLYRLTQYIYLSSPVSRHIVLMRTYVINLLNRVPEHDSLTIFVLHRTKCKEREPNPNPKP